jgi:hypothetical protein
MVENITHRGSPDNVFTREATDMIVERGWFIPTVQFGPHDVFLFEDWEETPVGPYRALFHFTPEDFRTLYANSEEGKDLVSSIHRFDATHVTGIVSRREHGRWVIEMDTGDRGPLSLEVAYRADGVLKAANLLTPLVPEAVARHPLYCRMLPRLAAPIMGSDPDLAIAGTTELGRKGRFRLERTYRITGGRCSWGGEDLGPLTECRYRHDMGAWRPVSVPVANYVALVVE